MRAATGFRRGQNSTIVSHIEQFFVYVYQADGSAGLVQRERRVEVGMRGAEHKSVLKVEMGAVSGIL